MAAILMTAIKSFIGLSTDTKPTSVPDGSTYHSVDTGDQWIFFNGMWERDLRLTRALEIVS